MRHLFVTGVALAFLTAGAAAQAQNPPAHDGPQNSAINTSNSSNRQVADYLAARGLFRTPDFHVERFVLFSSRNSTGGGPYVVEASYPLLTSP